MSSATLDVATLVVRLRAAGCVAAEEEARELLEAGGGDQDCLEGLLVRRLGGEPLAWITGVTRFCDLDVHVDPGVYVPRWQSEELARRAVVALPDRGTAVDLCTGSGALAAVIQRARPAARVLGTDLDPGCVACARRNGVDARLGDLFEAVPASWRGVVDLVVAVAPYVPRGELAQLPRDTFAFESTLAYDGGEQGTEILRRVIAGAADHLGVRGTLLLEVGGEQAALLADDLERHGFDPPELFFDEDGDLRGLQARAE